MHIWIKYDEEGDSLGLYRQDGFSTWTSSF